MDRDMYRERDSPLSYLKHTLARGRSRHEGTSDLFAPGKMSKSKGSNTDFQSSPPPVSCFWISRSYNFKEVNPHFSSQLLVMGFIHTDIVLQWLLCRIQSSRCVMATCLITQSCNLHLNFSLWPSPPGSCARIEKEGNTSRICRSSILLKNGTFSSSY